MGSLESELVTIQVQSQAGLSARSSFMKAIRKAYHKLNNRNLITYRYQWGVIDIKILQWFISYPLQLLIFRKKRNRDILEDKKIERERKKRETEL